MASGMILGQTRARISMGRLAELVVPVPPLTLQQDFARLFFGESAFLHGLPFWLREPLSQVMFGPENRGRSVLPKSAKWKLHKVLAVAV